MHRRLMTIPPQPEGDMATGPHNERWQRPLRTPGERVASLLGSSRLSDIEIIFPKRYGTIKAHRLVLAMTSPVFEDMLYGIRAVGKEINNTEDDPDAFAWMMGYIYMNQVLPPSPTLAVEICSLAKKYQIDSLTQLCEKYLLDELKDETFAEIYNSAIICDSTELLNRCTQMARNRSGLVLAPRVLFKLNLETFEHLLKQILYVGSEVKLFRAVLSWGKCQLEKRRLSPTKAHLRQTIDPLLSHIRFLTMAPEEFTSNVIPTEVFTANECMVILMAISDPFVAKDLPSVCSTIREKRERFDRSQLKSITFNMKSSEEIFSSSCTDDSLQVLKLKCDKTVYLSHVEISKFQHDAMDVVIKDPTMQTLKVIQCPMSSGSFGEVITLHPGMSFSISVNITKTCEVTKGPISCQQEGVSFTGEGLSDYPVTLFYWYLE